MPHYCFRCGGKLEPFEKNHFRCQACGRLQFQNPIPAATALIIQGGKLLFVKRARPPRAGYWDFPGGFLEPGEIGETCIVRELKEELGAHAKVMKYFESFSDEYYHQGHRSTVLNLYFFCSISREKLVPADDVSDFAWFPVKRPPRKIAFQHMTEALKQLKKI
jgi:mutator protein MutT